MTPYFVNEAIAALKSATDPEQKAMLRARIAVNIGDQAVLREIFGLNSESLVDFYPDMIPASLTTDETIASFMERYCRKTSPETPASPPSPQVPVVPAIDYAMTLEQADVITEDIPADNTLNAIDAFLNTNPAPQPRIRRQAPKPAPEPDNESRPETAGLLTESFARIMIKNGNYAKALEIFTNLANTSPSKNAYLSDQIRFLRKLIINSNS